MWVGVGGLPEMNSAFTMRERAAGRGKQTNIQLILKMNDK